MHEFLSNHKPENSYGSVVNNHSLTGAYCGRKAEVEFQLYKVPMAIHRKSLQCVTFPSKDYVGGKPVRSDDGVIKVVPGMECILPT